MNTDPQSSIRQSRRIVTGLSVALMLFLAGCREQPVESPTAERPEMDASSGGVSSISFDDITAASGVNSTYRTGQESENYSILESLGGGTGAFDYDHDGQPDLMFAGGGKFIGEQIVGFPTRLFRNRNGTSFANVSAESGLVPPRTYTQACSMCDYDCDGFPDALLTGYAGLQLFRNLGDGTFLEVHEATGLLDETWSSSAAWGDLNNDNWPDLYLTHYVNWSFENHPACPSPWPEHERDVCPPRAFEPLSDIVYFSRGDGTFYDASEEAQLRADGKGLGVIIADLDHDQDLDIYVANDMVDNFLYKNDGNGHFTEDGLVSGTATDFEGRPNGSMGLAVCDYNGDLTPDLWVTNFEQESFGLYKNDGNANFVHTSREAGITAIGQLFVGFGTVMGDLDCDGDEDAVISNGHVVYYPSVSELRQVPLLLQNSGNGRFASISSTQGSYFSSPHIGRGLLVADLNSDGLLDLVAAHNNEPASVLLNKTKTNTSWVQLRLVGTHSSRDAVGARVILHTSDGDQLRHVYGGGSFQSQNDLSVHFGITGRDESLSATVFWPSGRQQELKDLRPGQVRVIVEK